MKDAQKVYANVVEWMLIHDGVFPDKNIWRKEFFAFLRSQLGLPKIDIDVDEILRNETG